MGGTLGAAVPQSLGGGWCKPQEHPRRDGGSPSTHEAEGLMAFRGQNCGVSPASKRGGRSPVPKGHRPCPAPLPPTAGSGGVSLPVGSRELAGSVGLGLLGWWLGCWVGTVGLGWWRWCLGWLGWCLGSGLLGCWVEVLGLGLSGWGSQVVELGGLVAEVVGLRLLGWFLGLLGWGIWVGGWGIWVGVDVIGLGVGCWGYGLVVCLIRSDSV